MSFKKFLNKKKKKDLLLNKQEGFSLLETLVSILIITIALSSFITLVTLSIKSFHTAKQRYTGAKIAQEGMELAVSKRNNNLFCIQAEGCGISDWQDNLIGTWEVDATDTDELFPTNQFQPFNATNYLCLMETPAIHKGKFGYCGDPSKYLSGNYTREISITRLDAEKILLTSTVRWTDRLSNKQLIFEEVLFGVPSGS